MWPLFSSLCETFSSLEDLMQCCVKTGAALLMASDLGAVVLRSCKGENTQKTDGDEVVYELFNNSRLL